MSNSRLPDLLLRHLPAPIRIQGRSYFPNLLLDLRDSISGNSDRSIPPRRLNISGNGPFRQLGMHNVELCRSIGHLTSDDQVFDLGCGIGRTALAMTEFLSRTASYDGLDIIEFAISWCRSNIASKHPNFHFTHANVHNQTYNPRGNIRAMDYAFPFSTGHFSFAVANSLFTHLLPETARHYICEVHRLLKPGGKFLSTWFLLDSTTEPPLAAGSAIFSFPHRFLHHAQASLRLPEQAVAFHRSYVEELFRDAGFLLSSVHHGGWSGAQADIDSGQDVIVATKPTYDNLKLVPGSSQL